MSSPHIRDLISRRTLLKGAAATPFLTLAGSGVSLAASSAPGPSFTPVRETLADTVTTPPECDWKVLVSWGDPLFNGMAPMDPKTLTRADQERRFGNNNDFVALFPAQYAFPWRSESDHLLMCVNHESSDVHLMYADLKTRRDTTPAQRQVALAAVGISVVEIERGRDGWRTKTGAPLNRRLTPFSPILFSGPAAQHPWIKTASAVVNNVEPAIAGAPADSVRCGTLANCSGGRTPWGTYLSSEENLDGFYGLTDESAPLIAAARNDAALVYDAGRYGYPLYEKSNLPSAPVQFDMAHNPYGPSLYGWVVEVDPYDVSWTPRKRTALGRKKGECATTALTKDGRVAVYMGDDQVNHFVFKFVSRDKFNPADRNANRDLLDHGALYAARFDENGGGEWVELSVGACNRAVQDAPYHAPFKDQGDVLVRARQAAVLLGATPMDRPEDVEAPVDAQWRGQGVALVVCTMNRTEDYGRPGNPRRGEAETEHLQQMNVGGHILRIDEDGGDNGATRFRWDVFALCGDPDADPKFTMPGGVAANVSVNVRGKPTMSGDRFVCPDNICFDGAGNVWIATDGLNEVFPSNDCVVVTPVNGAAPRPVKRFLVGPIGAEICGPALTPDEHAFFCAIQHPGENDLKGKAIADLKTAGLGPGSHFPRGGGAWPLSSVVVVTRKDGKKVWA